MIILSLLFILIGILPSIVWLCFFLRKDVHPEPNSMVIKIFLFGALAILPTYFIELGSLEYISFWFGEFSFFYFSFSFLGAPFIEELMKYLVTRDKVLSSSELDEPADVILYMIISGLGFAAFENILQLITPLIGHPTIISLQRLIVNAVVITLLRFWGAIFLHALCSGFLGYFLAFALFDTKRRIKLKTIGILGAFFLHGLFNFSIIGIGKTIGGEEQISILNLPLFLTYSILIVSILVGLAIFVSFGFKRLQKVKSICKIIL